ncbi:MAG TPA: hypothetical protein DCW90_16445 [Lachnospiraceae bacterium]|nr:hypothetical protein [uncultured Lachnoclostridium sp.]HAU87011.1 hypothetical protein [Lachnospiraceae bacterium]
MNKEKVEFMKDKLLTISSYYSDIREYWTILGDLDEKYDETLEWYNFDEWLNGSGEKRTGIAAIMLRKTQSVFWDLYRESESELYCVYKEICSMEEEEQIEIWNRKRKVFEQEDFEEFLSDAFEYQYGQTEAMKEFLRVLDEMEN